MIEFIQEIFFEINYNYSTKLIHHIYILFDLKRK